MSEDGRSWREAGALSVGRSCADGERARTDGGVLVPTPGGGARSGCSDPGRRVIRGVRYTGGTARPGRSDGVDTVSMR